MIGALSRRIPGACCEFWEGKLAQAYMSILALGLLLTSAVLHALWNLLLKKSDKKYIAMGWQNIISGAIALLALFFTGLPPQALWPFVLISGTLEAIYFGLLTFAYHDHDFSLVYPVARGAAPALVVIWSALFLNEIPSVGGFIGIALVVCGLAIIGATSLFQANGGQRLARPRFRQRTGFNALARRRPEAGAGSDRPPVGRVPRQRRRRRQ
jgi:multidrug transporter EmrE-like cation transporter